MLAPVLFFANNPKLIKVAEVAEAVAALTGGAGADGAAEAGEATEVGAGGVEADEQLPGGRSRQEGWLLRQRLRQDSGHKPRWRVLRGWPVRAGGKRKFRWSEDEGVSAPEEGVEPSEKRRR